MPIKNNWLSNHHSFGTGYKKGYEDGYAKAIDEFAKAVKAEIFPMLHTEEEYVVAEKALDDIEKELKGA